MSKLAEVDIANGRPQGFRSELARWLEPLRQALAQLLRELGSPPTPRALQNLLDIPYAPCWRVFRIVRATDVTTEARHAPSPAGLKGLLSAARRRGASDPTSASVATTAAQFRAFITRHAEDRSTFDSMVATQVDGGRSSETEVLRRRRTAYRATSQLWGVQTDLQCIQLIVGPPEPSGPTNYGALRLSLQRGVRRLRADAQVTLMGYHPRPVGPEEEAEREAAPLALDPEAATKYGMPILPAFSSSPLPRIEPVTMASGWRLYNLVGGDVGLRSNIEFAAGQHGTESPAEIGPDGRPIYLLTFTTFRKPLALLVMDLLLHRSTFQGVVPESIIHQHQEGDYTQATAERSQRFPGTEQVAFAGRGDMLDLIEAPRYGELLRSAVAARNWNLADFDAYRLRIPCPMLCTTARVYFRGPAR